MNATECIKGRRSIRKFKNDKISHSLLESIISTSSFTPSWKNTQITRYIAIEDTSIIQKIADDFTPEFNANIVRQVSTLIAVTFIKGRCGFERDGSFTTDRGDTWQMYDAGVASQTFCLAAHEAGLGTVIMGIFDRPEIEQFLELPEDRELVALIPVGYPDEEPVAPRRKPVSDLLSYK